MLICWDGDQTRRPNFGQLYLQIKGIFEELMERDSGSLNCQYESLNDSEYEMV